MKTINVKKRFTLQLKRGEFLAFAPGIQEVADEIADHAYTKIHSVIVAAKPSPNVVETKPSPNVVDIQPKAKKK